jgi:hypothetical protein
LATITASRRPTSRYRPPVPPRHLPPIPPQWLPALHAFREPPPLSHFVLLSLLLHALFITLFGAPSGGSREGRAMWGSMQVELRGLLIDTGRAPFPVPRPDAPQSETVVAPPAPAREDRGEGAVPMTRPAETEAAAVAPSGPAIVEVPAPFPPLLDRLVRPDPRLDETPPLRVPPPTAGRDLRPPPRERPAPSPVEVPAPLPLAPAPPSERVLGDTPMIAAPILQPVPAPLPAPERSAPPAEAAAAPRPIAQPAPTVEVQAIPVPPLESVAMPRDAVNPVEMGPMPEMRVVADPPVERAPPQPAASTPAERPAQPLRSDMAAPPGPRERSGRRTDDPSATYDPTAPTLDPDALRRRSGEIAREGTGQRSILAFPMPPVPEKKSKLQTAIENARKPDCRTAYQGLGLAAIVPLIANEFGEGSCRW